MRSVIKYMFHPSLRNTGVVHVDWSLATKSSNNCKHTTADRCNNVTRHSLTVVNNKMWSSLLVILLIYNLMRLFFLYLFPPFVYITFFYQITDDTILTGKPGWREAVDIRELGYYYVSYSSCRMSLRHKMPRSPCQFLGSTPCTSSV